jgi:hypothetical protein
MRAMCDKAEHLSAMYDKAEDIAKLRIRVSAVEVALIEGKESAYQG